MDMRCSVNKMSRIVAKMNTMVSQGQIHEGQVFEMLDMVNLEPRESLPAVLEFFMECFQGKSERVKVAVTIFDYFVKNCGQAFHQAVNNATFQDAFRGLLRHRRGKAGLISSFRSNRENWEYIEGKVLFIVQLWYDAFMLQEGSYRHLIATYKLLREEGV
jgi:hypothetical protein